MLTVLCDGYEKETINEKEERTVLRIHPYLAAYKAAVLPLTKTYRTCRKNICGFVKMFSCRI